MTKPSWRDTYKVHPAADAFPRLPEDELRKLGEDIKANGLQIAPALVDTVSKVLCDGRNRLDAMEVVGIQVIATEGKHKGDFDKLIVGYPRRVKQEDVAAFVISANIHRRHLTKVEQAELIVRAFKATEKTQADDKQPKLPQVEEVSQGGRGKVNETKAKAVAEAKQYGISESTVERAAAKIDGKTPKPKTSKSKVPLAALDQEMGKAETKPKNGKAKIPVTLPDNTIKEAREWYATFLAVLPTNQHADERVLLGDAWRRIADEDKPKPKNGGGGLATEICRGESAAITESVPPSARARP